MRRLLALAFVLIAAPAFAQFQPSGIAPLFGPQATPLYGLPSSLVDGGGSFTPQLLGPQSCTVPAYSFTSATTSGYGLASSTACVVIGGTQKLGISTSAVTLASGVALALGDSTSISQAAADRIEVATGDSFKIVSGGLGVGTTQTGAGNIEASASVISPVFNVGTRIANSSGVTLISMTAPTVTTAGTSPSVTANNGPAAFRVNVGTGGTATTIVLALPTATTGWNCHSENITATAANRANQRMVQQASTTTSATLQNQTISTGAALAFTASDIVAVMCLAF